MKALVRARVILPLLAALLVCASASAAQSLSLSGTVRDSTGVVPGASVTLASAGREIATTITDPSGNYRFAELPAGSYELSVSLRGFETATRNIALGPTTGAVDVVLAIGRVNTSVSVTATAGKATATRLPVPDVDVPAQVSTIPQELILQQGNNTIGDALRNASGVQATRWYGAYEQYTIRGFFDADRDGFNAVMVDGMRRNGNRYATQSNNVEAIEVLKGPSSILYGRGALGGSINIIRKKPQAVRSGEVFYRGGRFNTHQVALGQTGLVGGNESLMYRTDLSVETSDGWRKAGADRLNVAPSLTWLIGPRARVTLHQVFVRDKFDGDGGVPLNIINLPNFRRDLNFRLPQDRILVQDSQTQALFTGNLAAGWTVRNSLAFQRSNDRYFVTEGVYGSPSENLVYREPLDFHHIRRPVQNQTEVVGRLTGAGTHNLLLGYEFHRDKYRTEVTAGDDPDCLCGYWYLTIQPMDITTMQETQPGPLDIDTVERTTFVNDRTHAFYVQDQIDLTPQIKVNLGYRADNYERDVTRVGGFPFSPQHREQTAHSYRAGIVFAPRYDQQFYFATSSSFTPVNTVPADGSQLDPSTARNYEVGHRWQGWNGRVDTTAAFYYLTRNNVTIQQSVISFTQVGEQISKGLDVDVNTDLGGDAFLVFNYGLAVPKFEDPGNSLDGKTPRFAPKHNVNLWLRKNLPGGFNAGFGLRYLAAQWGNNANTERLDDYTIFSGAVGYRTPGWDWTVNAENLFNNDDYFLPGHFGNNAFPGQPINITTTFRLKWR